MSEPRKEVLAEGVEIWLGDMLDILPSLGDFDACVTDPPYGIGRDGQVRSFGGHGGRKAHAFKGWDSERPSRQAFDLIRDHCKCQIIWGGNFFADLLPATGKWLIWDKGQRINQSDAELAYTSFDGALRIFELNRVALMQDGSEHPTQKPIELMKWCLDLLPAWVGTILDPYMGSGSTGVAAVKRGRAFYGIERDTDYFSIACRRISEALKQPDMFIEKPKPIVQQALEL